jgi:probable HAF family extracellular repeat protein
MCSHQQCFRHSHLKLVGWLLAPATALLISVNAAAQTYQVVELSTLAQGNAAIIRGPNGAGVGVGGGHVVDARSASGPRHGLLFERGATRQITGLPGSDDTVVFGINDAGGLVGASNQATAVRGFAGAVTGAIRELPPLSGDTASVALALNNLGQAVGFSSGASGQRAVSWDASGVPTALAGSLASSGSRGTGINERGDIAGVIGTASGPSPALWPGGSSPTLLTPLAGYTTGEANAINARGDVVGYSANESSTRRASLWRWSGGVVDLGTLPGGSFSHAFGINDTGDIVGTSNSSIGGRAVLWRAGGAIVDLNALIPASPFVLATAVGINSAGTILAMGYTAEAEHGAGAHTHDETHELPIRVFLLIRSGGL